MDEFMRYAMLKGLGTAFIVIQLKKVYPKIISFFHLMKNKYFTYKKLKDDSDDD